jgi:hypothetical protein
VNRDTFARLAEAHRQALKLYCYRMLGSRITQLTLFMKPLGPDLFPAFRLPLTLRD